MGFGVDSIGPILNREQSRQLDRLAMEKYGISGLVLMENAGRGAVDVLCRLEGCFATQRESEQAPTHQAHSKGIAPDAQADTQAVPEASAAQAVKAWKRLEVRHRDFGGPVVICCGRGNNAGDGLVMARHLSLRGHPVQVFLWSEPEELSPDAAANYAILQKAGLRIECFGQTHDPERLAPHVSKASWIVDALLGTGARGRPRPPFDAVIEQLNASGKPIFAVDLPSGLDCDTGSASEPTIRAAVTCTFAAAKPGLLRPEAQPFVGHVVVADIGILPQLFQEVLD